MGCNTRMSLLDEYPAVTYSFGILFLLIAFTAFISNILVLIIIKMPGNFTKSNRILASLAVSDMLVGLFLAPVTAWQLLDNSYLTHCTLDRIRVFLSLALSGSSTVTLAVVALDRYILMSRMTRYNEILKNRNIIILLLFAWILPITGACVRFAGRIPYLTMVMICRFGPLVVLIIVYVKITLAVRRQEQKMKSYSNQNIVMKQDIVDMRLTKDGQKQMRKSRGDIRLAKVVTILIVCYLICIIPLSCWAILGLINTNNIDVSKETWQFLYIISITLAYGNSSCNPVIYFVKTPTFKKGLKKLLKWRSYVSNNSDDSMSKTAFSHKNYKIELNTPIMNGKD